jgi:NAD(P)-dependent dehydrogenase (short-subunit alcohol dehydrogenase family)
MRLLDTVQADARYNAAEARSISGRVALEKNDPREQDEFPADRKVSNFATYPSLRDQVVIITGGASGIGAAFVQLFAEQGARVGFLDIQTVAAQGLVEQLSSRCPHVPTFFECDLADVSAIQRVMDALLARMGTPKALVNNAGNDTRHETESVTSEFWDRCIAENLRHHFFVTQALIPALKSAGRGSIINISSIAPIIPSTGLPAYIAAKAGIVGLTRTLSKELGPWNIRVNAILPGAIQTERQLRLWLTPEYMAEILDNQSIKRMLLPEEVARLALFLASDDSNAITGQSHIIDGGWV